MTAVVGGTGGSAVRAVEALRSAPPRSWPSCGHRGGKKVPETPSAREGERAREPSGVGPRAQGGQSWQRRLVSLVERLVRLEPPRVGEGMTSERRIRKSIHARESRYAMVPARAVFKQVPQRSLAARGTEGRRRMRAVRI